MKKFVIVFLTLVLTAGYAWAVDTTVTGSYYARGKHSENYNLSTNSNSVSNPDTWDGELDLKINFVQSETSLVHVRLEILDETWPADTAAAVTYTDSNGDTVSVAGAEADDDVIEVQRVYLQHMFPTNTIVSAGKMSAGAWATAAFDTEGDAYRVKIVQPLSEAFTVLALTQKIAERSGAAKDTEKDDYDGYALGAILKFGNFQVLPLWFHLVNGGTTTTSSTADEVITDKYFLAAKGNFGMVGFEAEWSSYNTDNPAGTQDVSTSGFYANVWGNLDIVKVGGQYMYAGWDETANSGHGFGEDYTPAAILTDDVYFGGAAAGGAVAATCFNVYVEANIGDKMSIGADYSILNSVIDDAADAAQAWYKASGSEFDITFTYKITDAVVYDIGYASASVDYDDSKGQDPEGITMYYHRLKLSF